jgi:superfamily II DNA or RNA helicase
LENLKNIFKNNNFNSFGFFIGGMSKEELNISSKSKVILATYSMANEGLDIPTLNAEFLITPKTDIIQSVGRILRAKHIHSHPIIYDFVDSHDVFQRQWLKRKSYYKKQNYKIIGTNSVEYNTDFTKWKVIYEPKLNCQINSNKNLSVKKTVSQKSNSSTDKSITNESDIEDDETENETNTKDKYLCGKCLLVTKK